MQRRPGVALVSTDRPVDVVVGLREHAEVGLLALEPREPLGVLPGVLQIPILVLRGSSDQRRPPSEPSLSRRLARGTTPPRIVRRPE